MFGLTLAFREFRFDRGMFFSPWVGFRYFERFFNHFNFWNLIRNTLVISFYKIVLFFPLPIIFALMLNEVRTKRVKSVIQTISYFPHFISWVIAFAILNQFLGSEGFINQLRIAMGMDRIRFMLDPNYFYPIMFLSFIWKNLGFSALIYISAIAGVDESLYEAAIVDGAGRFKRMWHITVPSILPTIAMLFILGLGSILHAGWDQIFLLRNPTNLHVSDILDTYIIQMGLRGGQFGYAMAVSLFQGVIGVVLIIITNIVAKKLSASELSLF